MSPIVATSELERLTGITGFEPLTETNNSQLFVCPDYDLVAKVPTPTGVEQFEQEIQVLEQLPPTLDHVVLPEMIIKGKTPVIVLPFQEGGSLLDDIVRVAESQTVLKEVSHELRGEFDPLEPSKALDIEEVCLRPEVVDAGDAYVTAAREGGIHTYDEALEGLLQNLWDAAVFVRKGDSDTLARIAHRLIMNSYPRTKADTARYCGIMVDVCDAVSELQAAGYEAISDISPANFVLNHDRTRAKMIDLSTASKTELHHAERVDTSLLYASAETIEGTVDEYSLRYAVGAIGYVCLTGANHVVLPESAEPQECLKIIEETVPRRVSDINRNIDPQFDPDLMGPLKKVPIARTAIASQRATYVEQQLLLLS